MNILVTGSSGYIGSNFIEAFKEKYQFRTFSLQTDALDTICLENIDIIIHFAALVHQKNKFDIGEYYKINTEYPVKLANKAKTFGVTHFIYISSIAVYDEKLEYLDEYSICSPNTAYGKSKLEAEQKLQEIEDEDFILSILRLPMVYGKNAPGNIKHLITLIQKIPLLPFKDTENKRSFIYIGNVLPLLEKIILCKQSGILLASDDEAISTSDFIRSISQHLHKTNYLVRLPLLRYILKRFRPSLYTKLYGTCIINNTRTNNKLNYMNLYSIDEGIKEMLK